jgi:Zn-dependent M28 family amino/carboxypeptidase
MTAEPRERPPRRHGRLAGFAAALLALLIGAALFAQTAPAKFDSNRAWEHLRRVVAIGPRPAGSPASEQTRKYITGQLAASGVSFKEQAWDAQTPLGTIRMVNIIATIPGGRSDRLAFAGHYDTKRFTNFRFVGASDGGSSTAFLIELARVLKARRNQFTIDLIFLDGEEAVVEWRGTDHTYGSRHYVEVGKKDGSLAGLKALVLVDMIGDRNLQIQRDTNSTPWLTDIVWDAAKRLKLDSYFNGRPNAIEDDHIPFLQAGIPSIDIIDLDHYAEQNKWHTAADDLDAVSARSLQIVGDVLLAALPHIEARLVKTPGR